MDDTAVYSDGDFVYVDPDTRTVVGRVQWDKNGEPVALEKKDPNAEKLAIERKGRKPRKRYYPWGTYQSMNRIYRLERKKDRETEDYILLESAIGKLQEEPFWDAA